MCGLFGFAGKEADQELINHLAALAETRGPHAYGVSSISRTFGGALITWAHIGKITENRGILDVGSNGNMFIGHCRLSTSGTPETVRNNQPLSGKRFAIAHNGNVYDWERIARECGLELKTECDSEVILRLWEQDFSSLNMIMKTFINSPYAILGMDKRHNEIVAISDGLPIYKGVRPEGTYYCSREFEGSIRLERGVVDVTKAQD